MPKQAKLQFAGSMGMFSLGSGWYYGKNTQWETDLFVGFIPRIDDMQGHLTITLKQTFSPFRLKLSDAFTYEPLTSGLTERYCQFVSWLKVSDILTCPL